MYINISVNNGSEKLTKKKKNTMTFSKLIIAVYVSVIYIYIFCTCMPSWLEYDSLFVGLGGWGVRGSE